MTARTYTAENGDCRIYTYKEGMLAAVAHDLQLRVTRFELEVDEAAGRIEGTFEPASIRVVCAMRDGREAPELLASSNFSKIEANLRDDVLRVQRYRTIRFRSTKVEQVPEGHRIAGTLELHGATRPIQALARREGTGWTTRVVLHQPDFGIKPYSAMLGTLRVRPDVTVELTLR